ncbi:MAG: hypothetical protein ABSA07_11940 [Acidimicrobiales bacterium]
MGVLVLGMHRSGTSALAGALAAMGFEVGPDDDLMPADVGNPEGYFELVSIVRANDDLLARLGGRWDSPPVFESGWTTDEAADEFVDAARAVVSELFESDRYLLKDPRISLLLPLWRRITNDRDCAVVVVRDPLEVAASLARRNGLPTLTGLALWAAYNRAMLRDLHGARVFICSYADLIESPAGVLTDLAASLRAWGQLSDDVDLTSAIASVRPELRRNIVVNAALESESSPVEINELMKLMLDQRGRHDAFDMGTVLESGWWEGPLLEERRLLLQWALSEIADREFLNTNLLTENAILWQASDAATHQAELLRARLDRIRRLVPKPLRGLSAKLTR